ncbi:MAG: peptide ABC transporter substrate-binding protein [Caldilinea sp.]|nr:peptide ABC transporter substrate-binding protein [Caldilinea sp.]MDW8442710.1 peptide ABC transporter substrate-binding protein [Caldilineaceae bacterium]
MIAVIVLSACTVPAAPVGEGAEPVAAAEKVLRINLGTFPDMIDPQKSSFVNEIALLKLVYEGLTRQDAALETVPAAAESWTYNDNATMLTFRLRDGLKYSDGSLLNAERFAYSIRRNIDPMTAGEYAAITDEILGAPEWRGCGDNAAACEAAKAQVMESVKASHADGSACTGYEDAECNTLTLTLSRPAPYFHVVMSLWVTFPAKEELITAGGENWWLDAANHVGNGPFIMEILEQGVRAFFKPNPNYWGEVPKVSIDFAFITDTAVAFEAYKNNEFDIIGLAAEDLEVVQADPQLSKEAMIYPGSCTFAVMFHQKKEPFTDQKVREAFAYALDREAWVRDVLRGLGSPTLTWIPKGFPGYDAEENRWGYDPEAARKALAESSYGSVENLPPITATFGDTPRNRIRWEWLVAKWKEVLGVDIALDPVEPTTFTALTKDINTAPQMFILGWCADYPDPQNWLSVYWKTGAFGERIGYSNPELDALLEQADAELDPAKRAELYAQAQRLLTAGAPVAFMWNNVNAYLVKPWVSGIVQTPQDAGWPGDVAPWTIDIDVAAQQGR